LSSPRDILNKLKWKNDLDIKKTEIWYIHRGAANDTMIVSGKDIIDIGRSFMKTTSAMIPYHRIFKIVYNGKIIFERR